MSDESKVNNTQSVVHIESDVTSAREQVLEQQILQLKKQQQLQHQILLQHFQAQQQQLAEQHEAQLRQHLKVGISHTHHEFWEQQKQLEEEMREKEKLEALKKKDKHEQSAVASSEVKQKLQVFLMKKQRDAASASPKGSITGSTSYRNCYEVMNKQQSPSNSSNSQVYTFDPGVERPDKDFPLRKTASEPNLLKVRIKQRVMERRSSPMTKRHDRLLACIKKKSQIANCTVTSNNSIGSSSVLSTERCSPTSVGSAPIKEEDEESNFGPLRKSNSHNSMGNLSLFSSPSMPNISIGAALHLLPSADAAKSMLPPVSEAQVRAACTARLGLPLTGQMLTTNTLPFYHPCLPAAIETDGNEILDHNTRLSVVTENNQDTIMAEPPVPHALSRLQKQSLRPLGRTQSSPLPLAHPVLAGPGHGIAVIATPPVHISSQGVALPPQAHIPSIQTAHYIQNRLVEYSEYANDNDNKVIDLTGGDKTNHQFLQQQRDMMMRHTLQIQDEAAATASGGGGRGSRPLSRALSSPLVHLGPNALVHHGHHLQADIPTNVTNNSIQHLSSINRKRPGSPHTLTTGLAFDNLMLKHSCICGNNSNHPEHAGRLQSIWARLMETGLVSRCDRLRSRKATIEELQTCHSEVHALLFGTNPLNRQKMDMSKLSKLPIKSFVRLACGGIGVDSDTTWNEIHTAPAARMAVGCVIDLAFKTIQGDIQNGFAVVRPPGHHAEPAQAMGFCFFNSVAVAARLLQQRGVSKILIVDWDVHHGNGTQQIFYDDPSVLFISIHRHDDGNFFPGTGSPTECGIGPGVGFNVNVAWSGGLNPPLGDAEYLAAFRTIVIPIAKQFGPEIILVSAGFDASIGHLPPLGGYKVSPACFGHMTKELMRICDGKVVLALEGGYDLPAICDSAEECVKVLLGDEPSPIAHEELLRPPCQNAIDTLQKTVAIQHSHWPCVKRSVHLMPCSSIEAAKLETEETETVTAMASLSMKQKSMTTIHSGAEPMENN
ncbi:histone deacetylase 4 isoform X3 [Chrysoperla carnea]|uniref:histone deacetylase 4 isoform X3 n=1 Tax=Chrysoperla carnea TaxID=189513 RepID=UPI001D06DE1F|nr:histone deacetylase 4 isoform X3 [Chrysoperla carnea]